MKDTFNKVLEASRAERAVVIESFMKAYEQVLAPDQVTFGQAVCQIFICYFCTPAANYAMGSSGASLPEHTNRHLLKLGIPASMPTYAQRGG